MIHVNFLAVLAVGILSMLLGMLWYSPLLFGKSWQKLMDFDQKDLQKLERKMKTASITHLAAFLSYLIMGFVLSQIIYGTLGIYFGIPLVMLGSPKPLATFAPTFAEVLFAMLAGFFVWLGFVVPSTFSNVLWGQKKIKLWIIDAGFLLVLIELSALLLTAWR